MFQHWHFQIESIVKTTKDDFDAMDLLKISEIDRNLEEFSVEKQLQLEQVSFSFNYNWQFTGVNRSKNGEWTIATGIFLNVLLWIFNLFYSAIDKSQ